MPSESTSPDDRSSHVDATPPRPSVSPRPSPPGDVPSQERGSTNASDSTTTPQVQEVPRNGTTASTIRAINDDDPPIPVWQVADHEKGSEGPQLHDGPTGPPRFPQEFDDSLAKKVEKERAAFPAFEDRLRHKDIGSGGQAAQETGSSTKDAAPMMQEEVIQGDMMLSTIHAMSDDDPPIPVLQVADHEISEGNQAERVANEFERMSDHPRDNAPTVHSTMGASDANAADVDPPMVGTNTSINTTSTGAAGREATNSSTTANAGIVTIILPQATMVTPGDDGEAKPTIVASIILPFYRRQGFVYVMVTIALLAIGIAAAVLLLSNEEGSTSGAETSRLIDNPTLRPTNYPSSSASPSIKPTTSNNPTISDAPTKYPSSSVSPSCGGSLMMIQIQYDPYPEETSYELEKIASEDGQETELASHSGSARDKNHEESICLEDGLYSFSFYDSYGDGFNGEYSLTLKPGETIIVQDNSESLYGEQVLFRLPFDQATVDVRRIGSDGYFSMPSLSPSSSPTLKGTLSP
ncbi:hypothetical protein THAOC_10614, partial [Thalassiosira oceanica]